MAEPVAPPAPAAGGKKNRKWIVIVAILIVALLGVSAFAVLSAQPPKKVSIELWYNNDGHYGDTETAIALTLQNSIQSCGRVSITLKSDPWTVFKTNRAPSVQKMPLFLLGWYPDYLDTDDYTSPFLAKAGAASTGSFYNNTQVDDWIREAGSTTDPTIRQDRYQKVQNQLAEDVPYIPLFTTGAQVVYVNGVQNVELHPVSFKWFVVNKPGASVLNVSTSDKVISLDPADAYDYMSIEVINQVFDTLLVYDWKTSDLKPGLAVEVPTVANQGISADADGKGKVNTAAGVIETPDPLTIKFHLFRPVSFFNALMAFSVSAPVPDSYSQTAKQPSTVGSVIGTGPYRLTTHVENSLVVLDKVTGYYNAQLYAADGIAPIPYMSQVRLNIKESGAAVKQDIQTKAVDVAYRTISPSDLVDLQGKSSSLGITVKLSSSPVIRYLVFNVNTVPNKAVRQAIAYSVDRSALNQIVFLNTAAPLYSMVPPGLPYASPVFQPKYGDAQCANANSLLSQVPVFVELVAAARDR